MGTRADFYVGRGKDAEWLGSIAWDGYPSGISLTGIEKDSFGVETHSDFPEGQHLFDSTTKEEFASRLAQFFQNRTDVTLPSMGWPWPWEDSHLTDYTYAFDNGVVYGSRYGRHWFIASQHDQEREEEYEKKTLTCSVCGNSYHEEVVHPDMTSKKKITLGPRSGLIVLLR
jgi:hypothetical protein